MASTLQTGKGIVVAFDPGGTMGVVTLNAATGQFLTGTTFTYPVFHEFETWWKGVINTSWGVQPLQVVSEKFYFSQVVPEAGRMALHWEAVLMFVIEPLNRINWQTPNQRKAWQWLAKYRYEKAQETNIIHIQDAYSHGLAFLKCQPTQEEAAWRLSQMDLGPL